jgi:hypothetical protein
MSIIYPIGELELTTMSRLAEDGVPSLLATHFGYKSVIPAD